MNEQNHNVRVHGTVSFQLRGPDGEIKAEGVGKNIITTAGLIYYAQRGANETPTNFTDGSGAWDGIAVLGNSGGAAPAIGDDYSDMTPIAGTAVVTGSYPLTNDTNTANTGTRNTQTVSYGFFWAAGTATDTDVAEVCITNPSPSGTAPLLMRAVLNGGTPINKGASDTLTIYVNHSQT